MFEGNYGTRGKQQRTKYLASDKQREVKSRLKNRLFCDNRGYCGRHPLIFLSDKQNWRKMFVVDGF